jgi:hypothetical protein
MPARSPRHHNGLKRRRSYGRGFWASSSITTSADIDPGRGSGRGARAGNHTLAPAPVSSLAGCNLHRLARRVPSPAAPPKPAGGAAPLSLPVSQRESLHSRSRSEATVHLKREFPTGRAALLSLPDRRMVRPGEEARRQARIQDRRRTHGPDLPTKLPRGSSSCQAHRDFFRYACLPRWVTRTRRLQRN